MGDTSKNIVDVFIKLLEVLECPVCFDYVTPPVTQCTEGHIICGGCKQKLKYCPLCNQTFSNVRIRLIDQISELMLYPCINNGCGSFLKLSERKLHEQQCSYSRSNDDSRSSTLQNSILKNIEEKFSEFFSQSGDKNDGEKSGGEESSGGGGGEDGGAARKGRYPSRDRGGKRRSQPRSGTQVIH